jgi:hypothetical protein
MKLTLKRIALRDTYTIGRLYLNGSYFCDTLEDKVRDINKDGDLNDVGEGKVYGKTAIPYGRYEITMKVQSPKFSKYQFYNNLCNGFLPRLLNVKHFDGILIHVADGYKGADLLSGCIGVGRNLIKGGLLHGREAFIKLYKKLSEADIMGETIWIQIE